MAVSASDVKKLRDMTGAGMMDCKEALTEANGDFEAAADLLRKKGLSKAAKKAGRETKEGLVVSLVRDDCRVGSLAEINCETDFVAKTDDFLAFVKSVAAQIDQKAPKDAAELLAQPWINDGSKKVQDALAELIGKLGENMGISRCVHFEAPKGYVHSYIHPGARVGVLIEVEADKPEVYAKDEFKALAHDLAMQVAAAMARFVRREQVDAATIEKEKEIYREQLKDSGKPANVIEKIIEGKLNKFFEDVCLVDQLFIKDQDVKVREVVEKAGKAVGATIKVVRFARYGLGEAL